MASAVEPGENIFSVCPYDVTNIIVVVAVLILGVIHGAGEFIHGAKNIAEDIVGNGQNLALNVQGLTGLVCEIRFDDSEAVRNALYAPELVLFYRMVKRGENEAGQIVTF